MDCQLALMGMASRLLDETEWTAGIRIIDKAQAIRS